MVTRNLIRKILKEEFDVEIPDDDAEKIRTVQDVIDYLNTHQV